MSPTSYRTALPRDNNIGNALFLLRNNRIVLTLSYLYSLCKAIYCQGNILYNRRNFLNHNWNYVCWKWWRMTGSNRRPSACKADALPAELILRFKYKNGDPYGIRTRVTAVKGRCLNRLTKGPLICIEEYLLAESKGFEPLRRLPAYMISNHAPSATRTALQFGSEGRIRTYDHRINSAVLYH